MGLSCYFGNKKEKELDFEYIKELNNEYIPAIPFTVLPNLIEQGNNAVCKIIKGKTSGTGFLCKIPFPNSLTLLPVLITCIHVLEINDIINDKSFELHFNNGRIKKTLKMNSTRKIFISKKYDVIIIEIKESDGFQIEKFLDIDNSYYNEENDEINNTLINQTVYLIHYPNGLDANLSCGTIKNINYKNNTLEHICTTYKGSSGSPILNLLTQKVIGIHKGDSNHFKIKFGTLLKGPIQDFNFLNKEKNEILITLKVEKSEVNEDIYFFDNTDYINKENNIKHFHDNLKELNKNNTIIYINDIMNGYQKYFKPQKEGIYHIRVVFFEKFKDASYMFTNCTNIQNIDFSLFKTDYIENMEYMFSGCCNLKNLDLSSFNTKNVINMRGMFGECSKVLNYNYSTDDFFPSEDSKAEDAIYYDGCTNLKDLDLSSFDTNKVTDMSYMFCGCKDLTNLKFSSKFNTKSVTNFYGIFGVCENLEILDLSSFNTEKATIMTGFFCRCYNLENIKFSKLFDTKNVTNMSGMFCSCESLQISDLSFFDTKKVVCMSGMFRECYRLTYLNLSSFNTENVVNMNEMFFGSYSLKKLNLSNFDTRDVKSFNDMFDYCHPKLEILNVENNTNIISEYNRKVYGNLYSCPLAGAHRRHHAKWYSQNK